MQCIAVNVAYGSPCCTALLALRASGDTRHFDTNNAYKNDVLTD